MNLVKGFDQSLQMRDGWGRTASVVCERGAAGGDAPLDDVRL